MMYPLIFGKIGITEILILLVLVVIFFGGKKIPELMRGMGRGVREFKDAIDGKPGSDTTDTARPSDTASGKDAARDDVPGGTPKQ